MIRFTVQRTATDGRELRPFVIECDSAEDAVTLALALKREMILDEAADKAAKALEKATFVLDRPEPRP